MAGFGFCAAVHSSMVYRITSSNAVSQDFASTRRPRIMLFPHGSMSSPVPHAFIPIRASGALGFCVKTSACQCPTSSTTLRTVA